MSTADGPDDTLPDGAGGLTATDGTPAAVELAQDRRARSTWLVFLAGPLTWFGHFMLVYVVAEAGCTGDGPGLEVLDPPVPVVTTIVATVVAVVVCAAAAVWGWRWWRSSVALERTGEATSTPASAPARDLDAADRSGSMGFAGLLLSVFSLIAVLFTGAPALVLGPC